MGFSTFKRASVDVCASAQILPIPLRLQLCTELSVRYNSGLIFFVAIGIGSLAARSHPRSAYGARVGAGG